MNSPVKIQTSAESILLSIKKLSETFGKARIALIDADSIACEDNVAANLSDTCRLLSDAVAESASLDNLLSGSFVKEQERLAKPHSLMLVSVLSLLNHPSNPEFLPLIHIERVFDVVTDLLSDLRVSLEGASFTVSGGEQ